MFIADADGIIRRKVSVAKGIFEAFDRNAAGLGTVAENAHRGSDRPVRQIQLPVGQRIGVIIHGSHADGCAHAAEATHALPVSQQMIRASAAAAIERKVTEASVPSLHQGDAGIGIVLFCGKLLKRQIVGKRVIPQRIQIAHQQIGANAKVFQCAVTAVGSNHQIARHGGKPPRRKFTRTHNIACRHPIASCLFVSIMAV